MIDEATVEILARDKDADGTMAKAKKLETEAKEHRTQQEESEAAWDAACEEQEAIIADAAAGNYEGAAQRMEACMNEISQYSEAAAEQERLATEKETEAGELRKTKMNEARRLAVMEVANETEKARAEMMDRQNGQEVKITSIDEELKSNQPKLLNYGTTEDKYSIGSSVEKGKLAIPYSERGVKIEERLAEYLKHLRNDGEYIRQTNDKISFSDIAILTTETGVEYTVLEIGNETILIRGDQKGTTISNELMELLTQNKGKLKCHSHPYVGDLEPSKTDRRLLELLPWQEESVIIEPGKTAMRFNRNGIIGSMTIEEKRSDDYYLSIFGEED